MFNCLFFPNNNGGRAISVQQVFSIVLYHQGLYCLFVVILTHKKFAAVVILDLADSSHPLTLSESIWVCLFVFSFVWQSWYWLLFLFWLKVMKLGRWGQRREEKREDFSKQVLCVLHLRAYVHIKSWACASIFSKLPSKIPLRRSWNVKSDIKGTTSLYYGHETESFNEIQAIREQKVLEMGFFFLAMFLWTASESWRKASQLVVNNLYLRVTARPNSC